MNIKDAGYETVGELDEASVNDIRAVHRVDITTAKKIIAYASEISSSEDSLTGECLNTSESCQSDSVGKPEIATTDNDSNSDHENQDNSNNILGDIIEEYEGL